MTNSPDTPEPALEGIGISKAFDQLEVLREVTIRVEPGEFLAVVGPNGAGKTTWCNIVSGFERQTAGNVRLSGRSVDRLRPHERYHRGIARTFQTPRIVDALTLEENVALAVRGRRGEAIGRARRFLRELGVPDVSRAGYDATLYERRVVELGRATINEPAVVILDEPLAGLRQPEHEIILGMARRLADAGSAVVIIEHLIPTIAPVVDRMVVLANTVLLADGTPADVLKLPEVIDAYLGQPMKVEVSGVNILELENVDAGYGSLQVLRDITFGVPQREVVALIGPNGAGKTTVMRSIAGVVRTTAGTIRYMGEDVTARRYHERVNGGVGWVPEGRHIFTDMTVDDNLYVSAATAGQRKRFPELRKRVSEMFPMLADRGKDRAGSLSGGQQQMLAIARALVRDPDLVILDEPSMGLAPSIVLGLGTTIRHMLDLGVAVLVADQSVSWLEGLAGSAVFIQGGQIVLTGDLDLIRDRDLVSRIYLGETVRATDGGQANAHARRRP